jgi:hypothetical protein
VSDDDFLAAFEDTTLPRHEWTHSAHLRMAFLLLTGEPDIEVTLPIIRRRIQAYNKAHGNPGGYHETVTVAFVRLVANAFRDLPAGAGFTEFCATQRDLFAADVLLNFYSREVLYSPKARAVFVEPDKSPLP